MQSRCYLGKFKTVNKNAQQSIFYTKKKQVRKAIEVVVNSSYEKFSTYPKLNKKKRLKYV